MSRPVAIRIGCNFGPVVLENRDIFGSAVHTANRMTSQAKAGQIITTATMVEQLSSRMARLGAPDRHRHPQGAGAARWCCTRCCGRPRTSPAWCRPSPSRRANGPTRRSGCACDIRDRKSWCRTSRANITIGRAEDNDLVVKGNLISRLHARVEINRNKFMLIDQSTNGTFVLGKDGEEAFVRRDSMQIRGEGMIGLGKAPGQRLLAGHPLHLRGE